MPTCIKVKIGVVIRCRACEQHFIHLPRWGFNGDMDKPTFTPSINESCNDPGHPSYQPRAKSSRCHFTVTGGMITYHGDCSHDLAGQTLPLEEWSAEDIERYNQPGYQE